MNPDELRSRIAAFPGWHYQFDLDGITTPIWSEISITRHEKRGRYFFDTLVRLCGGSLKGRRVLDLGCNAGWWSLKAIEAGCDFVAGIDGRQMHIDQANLIFEAKRVDPARYQFTVGNVVAEPWPADDFDVVLCLGLLYHISKPVELMERISGVNNDLLVVDTEIIDVGGSYWLSHRESLKEPWNAVDFEIVLIPSRRAVMDLAGQFGYTVVPLPPNMTRCPGVTDYLRGERLAFMCAKRTDLSGLAPDRGDSRLSHPGAGLRKSLRTARRWYRPPHLPCGAAAPGPDAQHLHRKE
jgi:SAM-dependent methyltransferase